MLGDSPTALDLYVTIFSHWRPRRPWLAEHCPRLHALALRAERLPALAPVMARNFGAEGFQPLSRFRRRGPAEGLGGEGLAGSGVQTLSSTASRRAPPLP